MYFILIPGHSVSEVECPGSVGADQEGGEHVNHCRLPPRQERVQTGQWSCDSLMTCSYPFKSCLMKPHLFIRQLLLIWISYDICVNFILKNVSVLYMSIYTLDFFLLCYKALYLQIALQYILEYPLGKHLNKHLEYYVTQLSYEMEMGRESALEMLATIFSSFPQVFL